LSSSPTGPNFVIAGYGFAKGSVLTDPPLPLDNVSNDTHVGVVAYANVLGKSAKLDVIVPYVNNERAHRSVRPCGSISILICASGLISWELSAFHPLAVAVGDGSTAVAMAVEVSGSIADRRLYRTHLRGAGNQSVSRVPAMNRRFFSVILLPTSECNVACDYCFEHKEPHRFGLESTKISSFKPDKVQ
jgi:hypothetical protein